MHYNKKRYRYACSATGLEYTTLEELIDDNLHISLTADDEPLLRKALKSQFGAYKSFYRLEPED